MDSNFRMNNISTDNNVERPWDVASFEHPVEDPMHTFPSDSAPITAGNDAYKIVQIVRKEMKDLIAQRFDRVYAERFQAEVHTQIEKTTVDMLQLGNSAAENGIKIASLGFLKTVPAEPFSREGAKDLVLEYSDCWMMSEKFMNDVVKQIVSDPAFIRPMARFIERHVDSCFDECRRSLLHAASGNIDKAGTPLPPSSSFLTRRKNPKYARV